MDSLKRNARIAGLFYLSIMVGPIASIPSRLIVSRDAAATVRNIAAHETLFRFGILVDLFTATMAIFLTLALYRLFKGVDRDLARLVVILGALMVTPISFVNTVNHAAVLALARGADYLSAFSAAQREAFAMLFVQLHHACVVANEVFWGLWLFPFGLLVYRSRFIPRILGVWLMANCFAYLALVVTAILWPPYELRVHRYLLPLMAAEVAITLWLLIVGAKETSAQPVIAPARPS